MGSQIGTIEKENNQCKQRSCFLDLESEISNNIKVGPHFKPEKIKRTNTIIYA